MRFGHLFDSAAKGSHVSPGTAGNVIPALSIPGEVSGLAERCYLPAQGPHHLSFAPHSPSQSHRQSCHLQADPCLAPCSPVARQCDVYCRMLSIESPQRKARTWNVRRIGTSVRVVSMSNAFTHSGPLSGQWCRPWAAPAAIYMCRTTALTTRHQFVPLRSSLCIVLLCLA